MSESQIQLAIKRVRLGVVLVLVAVALAGCVTSGAEPGVYVAHMPNGAPGWSGGPEGIPVWSPASNLIAWGSEEGVFLVSGDGAVEKLADASVRGRLAWSPDGTSIAFIDVDKSQLLVIDAETGLTRFNEPIVHEGINAPSRLPVVLGGPAWSPDGSRLAFVCSDGAGDEICLIRANGMGRRQITQLEPLETSSGTPTPLTPAAANAGPPAWSPDGTSLAVAMYPERFGGTKGVFIVDVVDGTARRVSELLPNSVVGWFPNGRSIYFSAMQPVQTQPDLERSDVFRVYLNARAKRNLTEGLPDGARNPALSPDGFQMAMESKGEVLIVSEQLRAEELAVSGLAAKFPAWSADSTSLALLGTPNPISVYD